MTPTRHIATFPALGSSATLVLAGPEPGLDVVSGTGAGAGDEALAILRRELGRIDAACSRFRDDSELTRLNASAGRGPVLVSALLIEALDAALRAARLTEGLVDPTVGSALELIGYDRDFASITADGPPLTYAARPVAGWKTVTVDRTRSTVALPAGVRLDLGATGKAFCADRAAPAIAAATGGGVLVGLGGDLAVAGPAPEDGWAVRISPDHAAPLDGPGPVVAIRDGGLASSSTAVRRWRRGGRNVHHIIDPSTSTPAVEHWTMVSVAAGSCLDANIASCAAMIMGAPAESWLEGLGLPARLERPDGSVVTTAGWPAEDLACC